MYMMERLNWKYGMFLGVGWSCDEYPKNVYTVDFFEQDNYEIV